MSRFGGSQGILRVEDQRLLTGQGRFADDLTLPRQCWMVLLRSPYAHARLTAIDTGAAHTMPGVLAVYTGADLEADGIGHLVFPPLFKQPDGSPMAAPPRQPLAVDTVRHVGQAVAAVLAETREVAQDAAESIVIDYEELPAVVDPKAAIADGAPTVWPEARNNVAAEQRFGDPTAVEKAFAAAAHVAAIDIVNNRLVVNALEPRAVLADFDAGSGRYTLHMGTQNPTAVRQMLAEAVLKVPLDKVRVIVRDIGGGFGMKSHLYPEDAVAAYAAGKLRRPVKWRADRSEEFLAATQARDHLTHAELALDATGQILALRVDTLANVGAVLAPSSAVVPLMLGPKVVTGVYHVPAVDIRTRAVLTNTGTVAPYRGAGRPEAIYLIERLMDAAAVKSGIDRVELRRRNLIDAAAMPYTNALGEKYDTGKFEHFLDRALQRADWDGFPARQAQSRARGLLRGRGLSMYIEWTGAMQFTEKVEYHISGNGHVTVFSATQAMGQGLETAYTQLAADRLGIAPERISVVQGDTDKVQGFGSMGSRSLFAGGSAVMVCADKVIERGRTLAGEALEAAEADLAYEDGRFTIVGTDKGIDLFNIASRQTGGLLIVEHTNTVPGSSWPNGCHVCEVEIDPETGRTEIVRYTTMDDVGIAVHPQIVRGQVQGGIAQGVGQALLEHALFDAESGQLVTGSFMDYGLPRADDLPSIDNDFDQSVPCANNPLGSKGVGESGTVGATPTVISAVLDALRPLGVDHIDMPATPALVWQAIQAAGRK
ncbi:MAG: xanthine dehydrogenase family protein molybdopterin-binding subunit [Reyranellaceae bacterium]